VLLAHLLGARAQGQYYVALSLYALLFFVLNQGVSGATVSQVAAASARGLDTKVAAWLGYLLKAYVLVGVALLALGLFVLPWFATRVVHADPETARWAFWLTLTPFCELPKVVACAAPLAPPPPRSPRTCSPPKTFARWKLFEIRSAASSGRRMPRSPCNASDGWRKVAGVLVAVRVAAMRCAARPDLPTPDTISWPRNPARRSTARSNAGPNFAARS